MTGIMISIRITSNSSGLLFSNISTASIRGLHILLAEDNELNMEIAEFMLQNEGAVVKKTWNGQEAVEIFRKSKPGEFDVILMDIMMQFPCSAHYLLPEEYATPL